MIALINKKPSKDRQEILTAAHPTPTPWRRAPFRLSAADKAFFHQTSFTLLLPKHCLVKVGPTTINEHSPYGDARPFLVQFRGWENCQGRGETGPVAEPPGANLLCVTNFTLGREKSGEAFHFSACRTPSPNAERIIHFC